MNPTPPSYTMTMRQWPDKTVIWSAQMFALISLGMSTTTLVICHRYIRSHVGFCDDRHLEMTINLE